VGNDADSHGLLSVVAAVHHDRVGEALDDGALGLAETLGGIATGGVGGVDRLADLDVVAVGGQKMLAIRIPHGKFDIWFLQKNLSRRAQNSRMPFLPSLATQHAP
jgi:hypothetical protein